MKSVLSVGLSEKDHRILKEILSPLGWIIRRAATSTDAYHQLWLHPFAAVVCELDTGGGDWKDVLARLYSRDPSPPLIVVSRLADPHLWTEVLNSGGFDVLTLPFEPNELVRVMGHAAGDTPLRTDMVQAPESAPG
jgi:DNA-binding NtrC family response regulator